LNFREAALKGVYWTGIHQVGITVIRFIVSIILARLLLPEEFGLVASVVVIYSIGSILLNSGLSSSLIRSKNIEDIDLSTVFTFNLLGSVIIYIIIFFCSSFVADFYNQEILTLLIRIQGITIIIQAFAIVQNAILTKSLNFKKLTIISIPSIFIGAMVSVYMAINGYGVWSLVWQNIVTTFSNTLLLIASSKWRPSLLFDLNIFKKHFNFGFELTISGIINTIFNNLYIIFIGRYFPIVQLGYYQRASSLGMYPSMAIAGIINKVSYPLMSKVNDDVFLKKVLQRIVKTIFFVVLPILISMAALATPLFRYLLTEKWLPAVPFFRILIINAMLFPIHGFHISILKTKGRSDFVLKSEIIKKGILLIIILGSFPFGIYGLLYGSVLASIISLFVNIYFSSKVINYTVYEQFYDIIPTFLLCSILGLSIYFIDSTVLIQEMSDFVRLLIGGLIIVIFYPLLAYLLNFEALKEVKNLILTK